MSSVDHALNAKLGALALELLLLPEKSDPLRIAPGSRSSCIGSWKARIGVRTSMIRDQHDRYGLASRRQVVA